MPRRNTPFRWSQSHTLLAFLLAATVAMLLCVVALVDTIHLNMERGEQLRARMARAPGFSLSAVDPQGDASLALADLTPNQKELP